MLLQLPLGTIAVPSGSQVLIGRGMPHLLEDPMLSRQHALFTFDAILGTSSVVWMARRSGRLKTSFGLEELSRGAQRVLHHGDCISLLADTGRHVVLIQKESHAMRPDVRGWALLEAASRVEANDAARAEARMQAKIGQTLVDARGGCAQWMWTPREIMEHACAASASSHPRASPTANAAATFPKVRVGQNGVPAVPFARALNDALRIERPTDLTTAARRTPVGGSAAVAGDMTRAVFSGTAAALRAVGEVAAARVPRLNKGGRDEEVCLQVELHAVADAEVEISIDNMNVMTAVHPHSEAAQQGLLVGDQLVSFNGMPITRDVNFGELMKHNFVVSGDLVTLGVRRLMEIHTAALLEARPLKEELAAPRTFGTTDKRGGGTAAYKESRPRRDPYSWSVLDDDYMALVQDF